MRVHDKEGNSVRHRSRISSMLDQGLLRHMLWHMSGGDSGGPARRVRLFTNGRNQAVRIPREFELPGDEALMRKDGDRLIIEPAPSRSLLAVLETLRPLEETFPDIADPPPEDVES
jgi:antitoxin VapB